jgi:uncharacterized protein YjbJ (UPF0337 family)
MEAGTNEKIEATLLKLRSKVKETAGMITDCPNRQAEGAGGRVAGEVQVKIGQFNQFWGKKEESTQKTY